MKNSIKYFLTFFFLSMVRLTYCQLSFSHDAGLGIYIANFNGAYGLAYSPRLNFIEIKEAATISVGTHFGIGSSFKDEETYKRYLVYDFPLVLELNIGSGSKKDADNGYGVSLGAGYGINYFGGSEDGVVNSSGLVLITSIKIGSSNFKSSYLINDQFLGSDIINVSLLFQIRKREKRNTYSKKSPYQK
jgi:hypothetical protein